MRKKLIVFLISSVFYFTAASAGASTVYFDDVNSMTLIDDNYSPLGVLFSTYGNSVYSDGHAYARSSSLHLSSSNVIGGYKSFYPYFNDAYITGVAEFLLPVYSLQLWAKPRSNEYLAAWMKAYNSHGDLIYEQEVFGSSKGEARLLSISLESPDIVKVEFSGAGSRAAFDNFSFHVAPEPLSSILFLSGAMTLAAGYYRKRGE